MTRYEFLAQLKANSWSIECNEHACNYVTAKEWIEDYVPQWLKDVPTPVIRGMKASNTIIRLQIYPDTPTSFNYWYGATLDSAIEQAMASHGVELT